MAGMAKGEGGEGMSNYWKICIEEALSELRIATTDEQRSDLIDWVKGAHENCGMAMGYECIPNPLSAENARLAKQVKAERDKVHCKECDGHGSITSHGYSHSATSQCWKCRGEGRYIP